MFKHLTHSYPPLYFSLMYYTYYITISMVSLSNPLDQKRTHLTGKRLTLFLSSSPLQYSNETRNTKRKNYILCFCITISYLAQHLLSQGIWFRHSKDEVTHFCESWWSYLPKVWFPIYWYKCNNALSIRILIHSKCNVCILLYINSLKVFLLGVDI